MRTINYTYVTEEQTFQGTAAAALPGHGFCHMAELLEEQATEGQTYQATAAAAFNQTTYGGACTRRRNPGHGFEGR